MRKVILLSLLFASLFVWGQNRPLVGLALSGGGAKGFAHAGVIEILDSLGFPIDMVAGTSMGSIVGGLYAIGYTPVDIQKAFLAADWGEIMSSEPQRLHRPFQRRSEEDRYLVRVGLSGFQPVLPGGFINGQKVYAKLAYYTQGYHQDTNFLAFPRKFLCVSTDLNTGFEQVITYGSLPDAMRASMAIPSVIQPHRYLGKWLIDGGVVNNFPANHLVDLGANIIIGVDVQTTFLDTISQPTMATILEKASMYKNYETTRERELLCDLIIRPNMANLSVSDFEKVEIIIEAGRQAARAAIPELLRIMRKTGSVVPSVWAVYQPLPPKIPIGKVYVEGLNNIPKATVLGIMDVQDSSTIAIKRLESHLQTLYGTGYFNNVSYHPIRNEDVYDLHIRIVENDLDGSVNLGLRYDREFGIGILINYTRNNLFINGGQFSADFVLGETPRYQLDYHFNTGTIPGLGFTSRGILSNSSFYAEGSFQGISGHDDVLSRLYWQATIRNEYLIGGFFGYHYSYLNFSRLPALREFNLTPGDLRPAFSHFQTGAYFKRDHMDHSFFPKHGSFLAGEIKIVSPLKNNTTIESNNPFLNISWNASKAIGINENLTLLPNFSGSLIFLENASIPYKALLGGWGFNYFNNQMAFVGFRYRELGTLGTFDRPAQVFRNSGMVGGADLRFEARKNLFATFALQLGATADRPSGFIKDSEWYLGYGLKAGYLTIAGPIEVGLHSNSNFDRVLFFFNYGYWF
jgi:NTE family protein